MGKMQEILRRVVASIEYVLDHPSVAFVSRNQRYARVPSSRPFISRFLDLRSQTISAKVISLADLSRGHLISADSHPANFTRRQFDRPPRFTTLDDIKGLTFPLCACSLSSFPPSALATHPPRRGFPTSPRVHPPLHPLSFSPSIVDLASSSGTAPTRRDTRGTLSLAPPSALERE